MTKQPPVYLIPTRLTASSSKYEYFFAQSSVRVLDLERDATHPACGELCPGAFSMFVNTIFHAIEYSSVIRSFSLPLSPLGIGPLESSVASRVLELRLISHPSSPHIPSHARSSLLILLGHAVAQTDPGRGRREWRRATAHTRREAVTDGRSSVAAPQHVGVCESDAVHFYVWEVGQD